MFSARNINLARTNVTLGIRSFARKSTPGKAVRRGRKFGEVPKHFVNDDKFVETDEYKKRSQVTMDVNTAKTDVGSDILSAMRRFAVLNPDGTLNDEETER